MVDFINQATEKTPARKPLSKGKKLFITGMVTAFVVIGVVLMSIYGKYIASWIWEEIWGTMPSGIIGPIDL